MSKIKVIAKKWKQNLILLEEHLELLEKKNKNKNASVIAALKRFSTFLFLMGYDLRASP